MRNGIHLGVGLCPTFLSAESPNAAVVLQSKTPLPVMLLSFRAPA